MENKKTVVKSCDSKGCDYYRKGKCVLLEIEIQDGECLNYHYIG